MFYKIYPGEILLLIKLPKKRVEQLVRKNLIARPGVRKNLYARPTAVEIGARPMEG